jgi:hypothetical protein
MENRTQELKFTPKGKSYWAEDAEYAKFLMDKFDELVPAKGEADTIHGEAVRSLHRLVYEHCNNGNCNAQEVEYEEDDCNSCDGTGYVNEGTDDEYECDDCCGGTDYEAIAHYKVSEYYDKMLDFLSDTIPNISSEVEAVRDFIEDEFKYRDFDDDSMHIYTVLGDKIAHFVLTTENKPREVND